MALDEIDFRLHRLERQIQFLNGLLTKLGLSKAYGLPYFKSRVKISAEKGL